MHAQANLDANIYFIVLIITWGFFLCPLQILFFFKLTLLRWPLPTYLLSSSSSRLPNIDLMVKLFILVPSIPYYYFVSQKRAANYDSLFQMRKNGKLPEGNADAGVVALMRSNRCWWGGCWAGTGLRCSLLPSEEPLLAPPRPNPPSPRLPPGLLHQKEL